MEGTQNSAAGNLAASKLAEMPTAARERYWEETTAEDKIERLRETVAKLCKLVQQQAQIMVKYGVHTHADGKLVVGLTESLDQQPRDLFSHDGGIPHRLRVPYERR